MTEIAATAMSMPRPVASSDAATIAVSTRPVASAAATPASPPTPPEPSARSADALQAQIDRVLADADTSLRFRVDEESDRIVVAVLDGRGDVILQVPNEAALALARRVAANRPLVEAKA